MPAVTICLNYYLQQSWHAAGKEFYALAWVMAGASRAIAQTLQQIPDTATAAVVIPDVPSLPPSRMHEVSHSTFMQPFSLSKQQSQSALHECMLCLCKVHHIAQAKSCQT